ncbi:MAG: hypothetical protein AMJ56_11275 [Anaerolineae bacterium SG8_19]|nr:MAG: hypothetical protein AMJ56_11275 [Anaerolineae bacterium SG8_19]
MERVPESERYSYIFDGASQLVDWILVTPWLKDRIVSANIFHINADYPYQLGLSLNKRIFSRGNSCNGRDTITN